jgi:hypothetical protein
MEGWSDCSSKPMEVDAGPSAMALDSLHAAGHRIPLDLSRRAVGQRSTLLPSLLVQI